MHLKFRFFTPNSTRKKWSLQEVESRTGIMASYIHKLERGQKANPTVATLKAISKVYKVELMTLVELVLQQEQGEDRNGNCRWKSNRNSFND
ncbi:MAG TPA: helix-turn-helix transcriptional regulator [Bacillus bacterium]|nr:helix-turn-helix transcriptional regulator [Bacillus sp. (in: firmicutes)]